MVFLFGLTLAFLPMQADGTYNCRYVRPSHLLGFMSGKAPFKDRVYSVDNIKQRVYPEGGQSDLLTKVAAEANDGKRTISVRGAKEDVDRVLGFFQQLDQQPRRVRTSIRIQSPVDAVDLEIASWQKNNRSLEYVEQESRLKLSVVPRVNADGTVTAFVGYGEVSDGKGGIVFRVKSGERTRLVYRGTKFEKIDADENPGGDVIIIDVTLIPEEPKKD